MSDLFVVVNLTRGPGVEGQWYVLGEEPHTFGSLEEAVECQAQMAIEFGHSMYTAPIYRLVPVMVEETRLLFGKMRAELERGWREADVI